MNLGEQFAYPPRAGWLHRVNRTIYRTLRVAITLLMGLLIGTALTIALVEIDALADQRRTVAAPAALGFGDSLVDSAPQQGQLQILRLTNVCGHDFGLRRRVEGSCQTRYLTVARAVQKLAARVNTIFTGALTQGI